MERQRAGRTGRFVDSFILHFVSFIIPTTLWYVAAAIACLLGMATKEVMATAPLVVLLYNRTFLAGSFREAWRRRFGLYLALAATGSCSRCC